jgi:F-type H+-transporting ATPase subunit delta
VYAEALIAAAGDRAEEVGRELADIVQGVFADRKVEAYLASPAVSRRRKEPVIAQAFGDRVSPVVRNLLGVLNQNGRLGILRALQAVYQGILDQRAGRVRVGVRTAAPLADDQKQRLTDTLAARLGREPVLDVRVEPELLGGLVVRIGDRVIDTSVRTRIESLRAQLMAQGSSYVANQN